MEPLLPLTEKREDDVEKKEEEAPLAERRLHPSFILVTFLWILFYVLLFDTYMNMNVKLMLRVKDPAEHFQKALRLLGGNYLLSFYFSIPHFLILFSFKDEKDPRGVLCG